MPRRASAIDNGWLALAAAVGLLAVVSVTVGAVRTRANGCIFDDGVAYCRMALGHLANEPFSRRIAVPGLVSLIGGGWSLVGRFELVAVVAAAGTAIATGALTLRLLSRRVGPRTAYAAALTAAGLVALSPHLVRLAFLAPVLTDQAATFLGLVWCLLATARRRSLVALSPPVAALLVATRDAWILPLLLASGVLLSMRHRALAVTTAVATVLAGVFVLTRPSAPGRYSAIIEPLHWAHLALIHPAGTLWAIFFGVGLCSASALAVLARGRRLDGPVAIVFAVACGQLVQALFAGADHSRLAAAALPFATALAIAATVELGTARALWGLVALCAGTILLWRPFAVPGPGVKGYAAMYYPGSSSAPVAVGGLILILTVLVLVVGLIRPTRGSLHDRWPITVLPRKSLPP